MPPWLPQWFLDGVLLCVLGAMFLFLYWIANKMLSNELHHLVSIVKSEWDDSRRRIFSVGSMNWRGFIALFLFGVIVIVVTSAQKLIGLVGAIVGIEAAKQLVAATNFLSLFFVLAAWMLMSIIAVVIDERSRSRRK